MAETTRLPHPAQNMTKLWKNRLRLVGHTDVVGGARYNKALSVKRAQSVQLFMVGVLGLSAPRIATEGRGESQPLAGISGDHGMNRRVEILAKEAQAGGCRA